MSFDKVVGFFLLIFEWECIPSTKSVHKLLSSLPLPLINQID